MIEFREVSEAEAVAPRPTAPTRHVSFKERRELLWPGEVLVVGSYVIMWRVWVAAAYFPARSRYLLAKLWRVSGSAMVLRSSRRS